MKTLEPTAIVSNVREKSEISAPDRAEIHDPDSSHHPFGSVLFRLKLALAVIYASRVPLAATQVSPRTRR